MDMSTLFDIKFKRIYDLEDCLESIRALNERQTVQIECLEEENKHLKSEHYKDDTIKELEAKFNLMKEDYYRGFPISKTEMEKIEKWEEKHNKEKHKSRNSGVSGGRYSYRFVPTGIGIAGEVICSCGDSFCFRELG